LANRLGRSLWAGRVGATTPQRKGKLETMTTSRHALDLEARQQATAGLARLLAETYTLYLKTHNFHWNVTGPHFGSLHTMFEAQYTELALAVDEIAERIRALGERAPGSYTEFAALATVPEASGRPSALEMVESLAADNETVGRAATDVFAVAADIGDQPTCDLAVRRQQVHEKTAWMLTAFLQ
jgi:starvation-inducible DNA-binding protein